VFTPTLTGLGERAHLTSPAVNLSLHALDVANVIKYERLENILLVGHSYGGMPISVAAELVPEGIIQSVMYVDAFFPEDGECLNDLVPGPPHLPDDPKDYLVPPPRRILEGMNAHLDAEARAAYEALRSPQSVYCFSEKAKLTGARDRVPQKTYVLATGYPNDTFTLLAEKLRKRQGWRVEEMPYTHDVQYVAVKETADMIESAIP
jgi:pimeloyl-ACP methyl ester carboxylesterase